jgi:hypothetical protein
MNNPQVKCKCEPVSASIATGYLVHEADRRHKEEWRKKVIEKRMMELMGVRSQIDSFYELLRDDRLDINARLNIIEDIRILTEKADDIHGGMYENIGEPPHVIIVWLENTWKFLTCRLEETST